MIVRRGEGANRSWPRRIVRRTRPAVGDRRPRRVVRRVAVTPDVEAPGGRRGRAWVAAIASAAIAATLAWCGWWAWHSPWLEVTNVEVVGAQRLPAEVIIERSGLLGQNIFTADLAGAEDALLTLPLVNAARAEREWPRGVRIEVVERVPWGSWEQGGFRYTIDREGVVLGTMPPPAGSLVIRSAQQGALRVGDRVNSEAVEVAASLAELLPQTLGVEVATVALEPGAGVVVTTADGRQAYFGDASGLAYKVAVWAAVSQEAARRGLEYSVIDLRFGNRPVVH